ncbi:MAG: glycogen synthase GlgA [bacterium]
MKTQLKILFVSPEVVPFSKTGGLADVSGALPQALHAAGHDIRIFTPYYRCVKKQLEASPRHKISLSIRMAGRNVASNLMEADYPGLKTRRNLPVYLLRNDSYFNRPELYGNAQGAYSDNAERFLYLSRVVPEYLKKLDFRPDIIHANDWHCAMVPVYLKSLYKDDPFFHETVSVLTIHNLAYQGSFWVYDMPLTGLGWEQFTPDWIEFYGYINFLKGGIMAADAVTTVSPAYAREIQTREHGCGLEKVIAWGKKKLTGILNGIDYSVWSPEKDLLIGKRYSADTIQHKSTNKQALQKKAALPIEGNRPLLGMVSRLAEQKGLNILVSALEKLLDRHDFQVIIQGKGDRGYIDKLNILAEKYPGKLSLQVVFDEALAHLIYAGSDFFLMPSRFEPCGLGQLIALRYGSIPIVRKVGGLADTVLDISRYPGKGNGLLFDDFSGEALAEAVIRGLKLYARPAERLAVIKRSMKKDYSWKISAQEYLKLYRSLLS